MESNMGEEKCPFKHCKKYFLLTGWSAFLQHLKAPRGKEEGHGMDEASAFDLIDRRREDNIRRVKENRRLSDILKTKVVLMSSPIIKDIAPPLQKDPNVDLDKITLEQVAKDYGKDSKVYQLAQNQYEKEKKKLIAGPEKENYMEGFDGFVEISNLEFDVVHIFNDKKGTNVLKGESRFHAFCDCCRRASHYKVNPGGKYFVCRQNRK
jgi:hypothetical protein